VHSKQLAAHLRVDQYGDFRLTDAIRPALDLQVLPREGFRLDVFRDPNSDVEIPVLAAAVSRERLFDVFLALLQPLGEVVDVVLETSHHTTDNEHHDLHREHIDRSVLMSYFCDYEDLLMNDGCTGVAVISAKGSAEVQFDEHKLLVIYSHDLERFEQILRQFQIPRDDDLKLISEGEHLHSTEERFGQSFEQLSLRLGTGTAAERVSWE
jgi:hypothetical protein